LLGKWKAKEGAPEKVFLSLLFLTLKDFISVIPLTIIIIADYFKNASGKIAQNSGC
jgi:hypothetical protein